jgi:hypothetical protein
VSTKSHVSFKLPAGPSHKVRRWTYTLLWLPTLLLLCVVLPQFRPIFDKLDEHGMVPQLTACVITFVRINSMAYCVPALSFVVGSLVLDATLVALLQKRRHASFLVHGWFIAVCCLSVGVLWLVSSPMFLQFKMSDPV